MNAKLQQIIYDIRHQPIVSWVTLIGTAMSIFLIMMVVMIHQVSVVPYPPESCRDRLMTGAYLEVYPTGSGSINQEYARKIYAGLNGVEHTSFMTLRTDPADVKGPAGQAFSARLRHADAEFWEIFDHPLINGRYYTHEEADAMIPIAVITETTALRLFGDIPPVGNSFDIDHRQYTVAGVVRDNSSRALSGSGEVFIPTSANDKSLDWGDWGGRVAVALLVKEGVDFDAVRDEVKARYAMLDTEFAENGMHTVYHGQPWDQEEIASGLVGSNNTPDPDRGRWIRYITYVILLIVPAINLSTMLHSRIRRRVSELGVRRAFGCTRTGIISEIVLENLFFTLAGGLIGLLLAVAFASGYSGLYDTIDSFGTGERPGLGVLLDFHTIAAAILACLLLNLLSAAVPAWQASRLEPVEAIRSNN